MRKHISEIGHKWRAQGDYIELDVHNSNFHSGCHAYDSPKYCKIMYYSNGTPYIKHGGNSYILEE